MEIRPASHHNITVGVIAKGKKIEQKLLKGARAAMEIVTTGVESLKGRASMQAVTPKEAQTTKLARSKTKDVPPV